MIPSTHVQGGGLLLLAAVLATACSKAPDLRLASNAELVEWIAKAKTEREHLDPQYAGPLLFLDSRAAAELASRPDTAVAADLSLLLRRDDVDLRCVAAELLGNRLAEMWGTDPLPAGIAAAEADLLILLEQPEERVRVSALAALCFSWSAIRPDQVPAVVVTSIRDLVGSEVASTRFRAAMAASWIGPAVASVAEVLTARLLTESDSGVRFALSGAVAVLGANHAPAGAALIALLDDAEQKLRYCAAGGLARLPMVAEASIPRLIRRFTDTSEAADVRCAAAEALVALVTKSEHAEPILLAMLDAESLFVAQKECQWLAALGTLGARVPNTQAVSAARQRLQAVARGENERHALVATSSLAKVAGAERDQDLGMRTAESLLAVLPGILAAAEEESEFWVVQVDAYHPVLESLVELAQWPEMRVDAAQLRTLLELLSRRQPWWVREWAEAQLRRLK